MNQELGDMETRLTAALLVISTTAAKDPTTDASAATLRQVFETEGGGQWDIMSERIVADDVNQIQQRVREWTDGRQPVNLVITTGGTGFAVADNTPEAIDPLLSKQAPGLVQAMMAASLSVTPFAMMSRPVAGVRHLSIIVTLPGSPKGSRENLQAIIKTLPHACLQAAGADSRNLHICGVKKLEKTAGLSNTRGCEEPPVTPHQQGHHCHPNHHHYGHGHKAPVRHAPKGAVLVSNDPELGPSHRSRESPYPMVSVEEALALIAKNTPPPSIINAKVNRDIVGHVLAQPVEAPENVPAFRASIVDGYAVVAPKDGIMKGTFPVTSVSHASPGEVKPLSPGELARITTGAPLPPGATSVIMVEDTILRAKTDDGLEEKEVEVEAENISNGDNVREIGSDTEEGSTILARGEYISGIGGEIGLLAAAGVTEVKIYRRPVVAVLSTGNELVEDDHSGSLRLGEVRDSNRISLLTAAQEQGFNVRDLGIAEDEPGSLEESVRRGLREVDVLITTGGVSMGELDLLKPTLERSLGGTIHFGRVAMKPGKPTTFATIPVKDNAGQRISKPVFSLPGNPASALVTFHLLVLPSLHRQSGILPAGLPKVPVALNHGFSLDPRPEYHRAVVAVGQNGWLLASSTGGQRSSRVGSLRTANALLCIPSGKGQLEKGSTVNALLMGPLRKE